MISFSQAALRVNDFLKVSFDVFRGQSNGLLGVLSPNHLMLGFGVHTGTVKLKIVLTEQAFPIDTQWEEAVEASWTMPANSTLALEDNFIDSSTVPVALPAGSYRLRYCAKDYGVAEAWWADGADRGLDEYIGPMEEYELTFWPAPWAPDQVLKVKSPRAEGMHRWARSLPKPA
jgi:hypothetical protein